MKLVRLAVAMAALVGATASGTPQGNPARPMDSEIIEMDRYGFYPKQVTRSGGQFLLYVRNATGLRNFSLLLLRQTGQAEKQKSIALDKPHWKEVVNLAPGTYTLTEASHPAWMCTITVK